MPFALDGVKVVDLSHHIAGPYCTKLLADYGAQVIKIERPDGGDPARRMGPFLKDDPHPEKSGLFLHLNTNKWSITLNLKTELGKKILLDLVEDADILVENFHPRVMPGLGLDYPVLEARNRRIIMTSISNFGHTGPYRDYRMSEIEAYAMGGVMHATGMPEREPIKLALTVEQFFVGNVAATASMGAFIGALTSGEGQQLDLSIMEMQVGHQDRGIANLITYQYSGQPTFRRSRELSRTIMPNGVYPTAEGYGQFSGGQLTWWPRFCRMIGRLDLIDDPHFTTPENFYNNPDVKAEVEAFFYEWLFQNTKQEAMEKSQAEGYLAGAINTMEDVFNDPHLAARNFFVEIDHPVSGTLKYPGPPFIMSETSWKPGRAPLLGEHNREVYCDRLGFSGDDLVRMREQGVI